MAVVTYISPIEQIECPTLTIDKLIDQWSRMKNQYAYSIEISSDIENVTNFIVASQILKFLTHLRSGEARNIRERIDTIVHEAFVILIRPAPIVPESQWVIDRKVSYFRLAIINQLFDYEGKAVLSKYIS